MDLLGVAAVIAALSGLVVAATGMVVALRVVAPVGEPGSKVKVFKRRSRSLPPDSPKPGESVALGTGDLLISDGKSTLSVFRGHTAWLERLFGRTGRRRRRQSRRVGQ
jgi:hypothetical protein